MSLEDWFGHRNLNVINPVPAGALAATNTYFKTYIIVDLFSIGTTEQTFLSGLEWIIGSPYVDEVIRNQGFASFTKITIVSGGV